MIVGACAWLRFVQRIRDGFAYQISHDESQKSSRKQKQSANAILKQQDTHINNLTFSDMQSTNVRLLIITEDGLWRKASSEQSG